MTKQHSKIVSEEATYSGSVAIGKDVLELVSSSMYVQPLTVYREYIQNAVDSIDAAVETGTLPSTSKGRIDLSIDPAARTVAIRDNGAGITNATFAQRMTSLGSSEKRGSSARGFRGVGRLAGLGYVQLLQFRSRSSADEEVLEITWDCRKLKALLASNDRDGGLESFIRKIVSLRKLPSENYPDRFFEVELVKPRRIANDRLLNENEISGYLSQVGPCPFSPNFDFGSKIENFLAAKEMVAKNYNIYVNNSDFPIYRPYSNSITYSENRAGKADELKLFEIEGINGETVAAGWILHHEYQGAIPQNLGVKGLRARVGNIQVGEDRIFSEVFPEDRFCSWTLGEVHILSNNILPNGRRDDFETNAHFFNLLTHLTPYAGEVAKKCRSSSQVRNRLKTFESAELKLHQRLEVLDQGAVSKHNLNAIKKEIGTLLAELRNILELGLFNLDDREQLQKRLSLLEKEISLRSDAAPEGTPLQHLSNSKQKAFSEVFDLIYECSPNSTNAKSLIDKILVRLSQV